MASLKLIVDMDDDQGDGPNKDHPPSTTSNKGRTHTSPLPEPSPTPFHQRPPPSHTSPLAPPSLPPSYARASTRDNTKELTASPGAPPRQPSTATTTTKTRQRTPLKAPKHEEPSSPSSVSQGQDTRRKSTASTESMDPSMYGYGTSPSMGPINHMAGNLRAPGRGLSRDGSHKLTPITGRISRAKKGLPVHQCQSCGKVCGRLEVGSGWHKVS
jgi:hypothetical protein